MLTQGYKLCILDVKYIVSLARKHNLTDQLELLLLDYPIASNYFLAQKLPLEINPFTDTFQYTLSTCTPGSYKPASLQLATHCEAERLDSICYIALGESTIGSNLSTSTNQRLDCSDMETTYRQ